MTLTSLSIVLTIFILQLHYAGPSRLRRVPTWIHRLFVYRLGPALGVRRRSPSHCRLNRPSISRAAPLSTWPRRRSRAANSVDPEVGTVSAVSKYPSPHVTSVRSGTAEHVNSRSTKRPMNEEDLITRHLRSYLDGRRAEQEFEDVITEWRLVALIFDRLMFWTFLVGTTMSTVLILVILPLTKPDIRYNNHVT